MFAVLTRPVARRTLGYAARCMASQPPPPPPKNPKPQQDESSSPDLAPVPNEPLPSLDVFTDEGRTGARSSKGSLSSGEMRRRRLGGIAGIAFAGLVGVQLWMLTGDWTEDELKAKKMTLEDAPSTRYGRLIERFKDFFGLFSEPAWPELLPPAYPPPHGKPYTLILSLDDLLVTSTWDRQNGWRTAKRPGVDYFLAYISQFYEVVVFTTQLPYSAEPILQHLDKFNFFITHRLHRESTRSVKGKIVKDISYLNRDLSKVVMIDTVPEHVSAQPENAVVVPKWTGDPKDRGLVALIPFLESIAIYKPADVRPILTAYQGKDIPLEYAKKEAESKQKHIEDWEKKKTAPNPFGAMFGLSNRDSTIPPTYLELKRKEAQQNYADEQAYIARNREHLEKLLEQEQQAMMAQAPTNLWDAFGAMGGAPPPPPPPPSETPAVDESKK